MAGEELERNGSGTGIDAIVTDVANAPRPRRKNLRRRKARLVGPRLPMSRRKFGRKFISVSRRILKQDRNPFRRLGTVTSNVNRGQSEISLALVIAG